MIFNPKIVTLMGDSYVIEKSVSANVNVCLAKNVISEFWKNFTFGISNLGVTACSDCIFSIGSAKVLEIGEYEYAINVTKDGISISAKGEKELIRGFMTLLDRIKAKDKDGETAPYVECCEIYDYASIKFRSVHFCIFPETELWELRRFLRFTAALKFTHITLEFWGMLKFDCMKELSWKEAYTKDELRPIIDEARALGIEIIPMFNHWGHAASSRARHGKHVVLDQNPSLQSYFTEDGWCWDIRLPKVRQLLDKVRDELTELCGEGEYFHIGCDEAYNFEFSKENMDFITEFINDISRDMKKKGRRVIAWGDMLLYKSPDFKNENKYCCQSPCEEVAGYLRDHISRDVIIADWQYDSPNSPVETSEVFKKAGFDTILCPWDRGKAHIKAATSTVNEYGLMGFMHTTWHTLSEGMPMVALIALDGFDNPKTYGNLAVRCVAAALFRKVMPVMGDYEMAGWSKKQIHFLWEK